MANVAHMREPQTPQELESEFPGWMISQGTNHLWHARKGNELVSGEDLTDLRDQIIKWVWHNEIR